MRLAVTCLLLLLAACAQDARPADPGADGLTFLDERLDDDTWRVRFRRGAEHDGFLHFPFMLHSLELAEAAGKAWLRPFRFEADDSDVRDGSFTVQAFDELPDDFVPFDPLAGTGLAGLDPAETERVAIGVEALRGILSGVALMEATAGDG